MTAATPDNQIAEEAIPQESNLQTWRVRILNGILVGTSIFGLFALIPNFLVDIREGRWAILIFYSAAYLWVIASTIFRRLPFSLRSISILTIAFALGVVTLMQFGLSGDGRIWILLFILMTSLLLGLRAGIVALVLSAATYAFLGYQMTLENGLIPTPSVELQANSGSISGWIATGVVLLMVGVLSVISISVLLKGLETSVRNLQSSFTNAQELTTDLEDERGRLQMRSGDLERRLNQIRTAAEISAIISGVTDPQILLPQVVNLILERMNLYYVAAFLLDEAGQYAVLQAGTGDQGRRMLAENHRLVIGGSSMVGWTVANRTPRIALDVGAEAIRFRNPNTPLTRSELALPLVTGDRILGALSVQSAKPAAFDDDDIAILQSIADVLATALENANLFIQTQENLEEIRSLHRQYIQESWSELLSPGSALSYTYESDPMASSETPIEGLEIPLTLRGEQTIGNLSLESDRQDWSSDEMEFIEAVTTQAALALENARLLDESQRRVKREQALNELTTRISQSLDISAVLQTVARELGQIPNVTEASVHLSPPELAGREINES